MHPKYILVFSILLLVYRIYSFGIYENRDFVSFLNVGQGDAVLIHVGSEKGSANILIDTGPDSEIDGYLASYGNYPVCDIGWLAITHNHDDHFGGLPRILERCNVASLTFNDIVVPRPESDHLSQLITEKADKTVVNDLYQGDNFTIYGWDVYILWPPKNLYNILDTNDQSLVIFMDRGPFEMLITGDVSKEYYDKMNLDRILPKIDRGLDIYKVSHHGSPTGHNKNSIKSLSPITCLIGVGKNKFGHPDREVVNDLIDLGCKVMRTDVGGSFEFFLDRAAD